MNELTVHGAFLRSRVSVTSPLVIFSTYFTVPLVATPVTGGGSTGLAGVRPARTCTRPRRRPEPDGLSRAGGAGWRRGLGLAVRTELAGTGWPGLGDSAGTWVPGGTCPQAVRTRPDSR